MITIGTDCSGIEAPIQALQQLGITYIHKWACENDKFARQSIYANYKPELVYKDITQRDHSQLPNVDIYVCGFPCQSFSLMGKKLGTSDPRSNIMLQCIDVIRIKQPYVFILENVKNFKFIEKGKPYKFLMNELKNIVDENGEGIYNVYADIYNTKDYGIPQNRERIYIIGIHKDIEIEEYSIPPKIPMKPLDDFIIDNDYNESYAPCKNIKKHLSTIQSSNENYTIGSSGFASIVQKCTPTIACNTRIYICKFNRILSPIECINLQGFNEFKQVVSNTQLYKQAGNTMSVNVVKEIVKSIINSTVFKFTSM